VGFLECCSGKSGQSLIINEVDLDAAAFGWAAAAKSRSKAAHALNLQEASGQASAKGGLAPARPTDARGTTQRPKARKR